MSRFNARRAAGTGVSAVRTAERPSGVTFEGAPGYARDPRSELFLLAVTSMVGEDTFYESGVERDVRLRELVARVAVSDYEWTLGLVGWLRTGALLRSVAIVAAAEAVRVRLGADEAGGNRALVRAALARADEPGEFLAYWTSRYGRWLPQPVKRGVADAAVTLYSERSLVKYDSPARGSGSPTSWSSPTRVRATRGRRRCSATRSTAGTTGRAARRRSCRCSPPGSGCSRSRSRIGGRCSPARSGTRATCSPRRG